MTLVFKSVLIVAASFREQAAEQEQSPAELAAATVEQCFADADLNGDGRLSFDEFTRWYMYAKPVVSAEAAAAMAAAAAAPALRQRRPSVRAGSPKSAARTRKTP